MADVKVMRCEVMSETSSEFPVNVFDNSLLICAWKTIQFIVKKVTDEPLFKKENIDFSLSRVRQSLILSVGPGYSGKLCDNNMLSGL